MAYRPLNINAAQFVNPMTGLGRYDPGAGLRALAAQNMQERQMKDDMTRHENNLKFQTKQHEENLGQRKKEEYGQNVRFSLTLADKKEDKQLERDEAKKQLIRKQLMTARDLAVAGKYEQVDGMLGTLAELGVEVNKSIDEKTGKPIYRMKAPTFGDQPETMNFEEIKGQFNESNGQQTVEGKGQSATPRQLDQENPYQNTPNPFNPLEGKSSIPADQSFDPYSLDTAALQRQVALRLNPILKGIEGAFPSKFQGRANSILQAYKSLGAPPEETLNQLQKPLDTAAGLMKSELGADAARQRMSVSFQNQDANRNIRLEDRMWRRVDQIGKSFDLPNIKQRLETNQQLIRLLDQNNKSADGLLISQLRNQFESGVMTDKDFARAKEGIKPILQRIKDFADEEILGTGLNPDSRAGIKAFLRQKALEDQNAVRNAQNQLKTQLQRAGSEEEYKTAIDYIAGNIPEHLWDDEIKEAYGLPVERKTGPVDREGNYSSKPGNTGNKSGKVVVETDINQEVEDLLGEE